MKSPERVTKIVKPPLTIEPKIKRLFIKSNLGVRLINNLNNGKIQYKKLGLVAKRGGNYGKWHMEG